MRSQELESRVSGGLLKHESLECESKFSRDFDSNLFNSNTPLGEIKHKVASYMGEKLFMPRAEEVRIGYDGSLDPEYVRVMETSISYWNAQGDMDSAYHFSMELEGMKNLATHVSRRIASDRGDTSRYIIGSDPGETYKTKDGAKTVIFVGEVDRLENDYISYRQLAIPVELLSLLTLFEKIQKVGDIALTEKISGLALGELTSENLVAYPVAILSILNDIAIEFGHSSWEVILERANDQLRLEKDSTAKERREEMIANYSARIYQSLQQSKSSEYINTIDESMRRVFAIEAGARDYLGMDLSRVNAIIESSLRDTAADIRGIFTKNVTQEQIYIFEHEYQTTLTDLFEYRNWMVNVFLTNPLASRALATGCGGGLSISGIGGENIGDVIGYDSTSSVSYLMQADGYQETSTGSFGTESSSPEDIEITLDSGEKYVLKIRDGWSCNGEGCGRVSSHATRVRIGVCKICEFCDPNVHKAD